MPPMQVQQDMRARIQEWLEAVMARHGVSTPAMAKRARLSPSTIYRALDEGGAFVMSTTTLAQIAAAFGEPLPDALRPAGAAALDEDGFHEEIAQFEVPAPGAHVSLWRLGNRALDLEGYLPGDILEVDMALAPVPGDIVCAQVYNLQRGTAETVVRKFSPPYLLTRSTDRSADAQPLYIDNDRVSVRGVVIGMTRRRTAA